MLVFLDTEFTSFVRPDAPQHAAGRAAESIDDALRFVEKSNLRIAALEKVP